MSSTASKRARYRRSQAGKRCMLIRRLAIVLHQESDRRDTRPQLPGLRGLMLGWPYGSSRSTGSIGGRPRTPPLEWWDEAPHLHFDSLESVKDMKFHFKHIRLGEPNARTP